MSGCKGPLDHLGEQAIVLGKDEADELWAVVGLDGDLGGFRMVTDEVDEEQGHEAGRVEEAVFVGIAGEGDGRDHIFDAVLIPGKDLACHLRVDVGDIFQGLDVLLPVSQRF